MLSQTTESDIRLFEAAREIQGFCSDRGWSFALIGGVALMRWGRLRTTEDVDGALLTMFVHEEKFVDTILAHFRSRIEDARSFALNNRVLLLTASNGVSIDVSLAGLPFEEQMISRASLCDYGKGLFFLTCSAEDLVILKAFAGRDKDWSDVQSVLERQRGKLDFGIIFDNLRPLTELKEAPEICVKLEELIRQVG